MRIKQLQIELNFLNSNIKFLQKSILKHREAIQISQKEIDSLVQEAAEIRKEIKVCKEEKK